MPGHDERAAVVREWVAKAENDLKTAAHTLKLGRNCPTDTVCFHAQQCMEKHLVARLVWRCVQFPRTHDSSGLIRLVPLDGRPELGVSEQERLTDFAAVTRYPGAYDPIPLGEAQAMVKLARRVRRDVRARLPRESISKGGR